MKIFKATILGLVTLLWAGLAAAEDDKSGLFVEPGVTYEVGSADGDFPSGKAETDADGLGVGARVGFHLNEAFFLGLDGRFSKITVKDDSAALNYDAKGNAYNWGPVVGFQMPDVGLRVWGDYIVGSTIDPEDNNGLDLKFEDGTGYRVGAGFHVGVVSLNLEYQELKYDKTTLEQLGPFAPGTSLDGVDLKNKSWIASVSFPMEF